MEDLSELDRLGSSLLDLGSFDSVAAEDRSKYFAKDPKTRRSSRGLNKERDSRSRASDTVPFPLQVQASKSSASDTPSASAAAGIDEKVAGGRPGSVEAPNLNLEKFSAQIGEVMEQLLLNSQRKEQLVGEVTTTQVSHDEYEDLPPILRRSLRSLTSKEPTEASRAGRLCLSSDSPCVETSPYFQTTSKTSKSPAKSRLASTIVSPKKLPTGPLRKPSKNEVLNYIEAPPLPVSREEYVAYPNGKPERDEGHNSRLRANPIPAVVIDLDPISVSEGEVSAEIKFEKTEGDDSRKKPTVRPNTRKSRPPTPKPSAESSSQFKMRPARLSDDDPDKVHLVEKYGNEFSMVEFTRYSSARYRSLTNISVETAIKNIKLYNRWRGIDPTPPPELPNDEREERLRKQQRKERKRERKREKRREKERRREKRQEEGEEARKERKKQEKEARKQQKREMKKQKRRERGRGESSSGQLKTQSVETDSQAGSTNQPVNPPHRSKKEPTIIPIQSVISPAASIAPLSEPSHLLIDLTKDPSEILAENAKPKKRKQSDLEPQTRKKRKRIPVNSVSDKEEEREEKSSENVSLASPVVAKSKRVRTKKAKTPCDEAMVLEVVSESALNVVSASPKRIPAGTSIIEPPPLDVPVFGLIQEEVGHNPYHLLIAVVFLQKTKGSSAIPVFREFIKKWPTPEDLVNHGSEEAVAEMFKPLGLQLTRARSVWKMANHFHMSNPYERPLGPPSWKVRSDYRPEDPTGLNRKWGCIIGDVYGCGKYAIDSWRIFSMKPGHGGFLDGTTVGERTKKPKEDESEVPCLPEATYLREFAPGDEEWRRISPDDPVLDKELKAYVKWMHAKDAAGFGTVAPGR
ncbi:hypothetical protein ABW20_dc0105967 [Dactylellina cionopaga]|nr:hypothetical protein ABW20_dc0105967 [Dactylellina cionopaga]